MIYKVLEVKNTDVNQIFLEGDFVLSGEYIESFLSGASKLVIVACSISAALRQRVSDIGINDIVYALALDGAGSAAVSEVATKPIKCSSKTPKGRVESHNSIKSGDDRLAGKAGSRTDF